MPITNAHASQPASQPIFALLTAVTLTTALTTHPLAEAQTAPIASADASAMVAEAPNPKLGDIWRFQIVDMFTKQVRSRSESQILGFENDRWINSSTNMTTGVKRLIPYTKQWGQCLSLLNSSEIVCGSYFSFPMQVGTKSGFKNQPWSNGKGHYSMSCEVVNYELIKVPAGSFHAFKVACKGDWQQVTDGRGWGRIEETLWYSPKVMRNIRSEVRSYSGSQTADWYMSELAEYVQAK